MDGDDDEDDIDDIEYEFNVENERNKNKNIAEAMLHGKMSYGRGTDDYDNINTNAQYPPVIAGRSRPVRLNSLKFYL